MDKAHFLKSLLLLYIGINFAPMPFNCRAWGFLRYKPIKPEFEPEKAIFRHKKEHLSPKKHGFSTCKKLPNHKKGCFFFIVDKEYFFGRFRG